MDKLFYIRIGDEVTFMHDGKMTAGEVEGWIDRLVNGKPTKCVELKDARLWVPVVAIVSRTRPGAGVISFSAIAHSPTDGYSAR